MNSRNGTWGEVQVGMYVQAPDGVAFRVIALTDGLATLSDRSQTKIFLRLPPHGSGVVILEPNESEAIRTAQQVLGAREIPHEL